VRNTQKDLQRVYGYTSGLCEICGAWKGAFGLEPTIQMYVDHTLEFLRAIRRVLRPDGVVFWNIGDAFAGSAQGWGDSGPNKWNRGSNERPKPVRSGYLPPKDLCLIPQRVAIAAQEDGWHVRADIIWNRKNCMPQSAEDRPTISHQYIWLLTKKARYYWDKEAAKEPQTGHAHSRGRELGDEDYQQARGTHIGFHHNHGTDLGGRNIRSVWEFTTEAFGQQMCLSCGVIFEGRQYRRFLLREREDHSKGRVCPCGASEWLSHFAVFPRELPRRCILAATSEKGNCSECGKPWVRVIQKPDMRERPNRSETSKSATLEVHLHNNWGKKRKAAGQEYQDWRDENPDITVGWKPQCECGASAEPATVMDICSGTGTTGVEAKSLGRKAILIDISGKYCRLSARRLEAVTLPLITSDSGRPVADAAPPALQLL
jgi:DNA modification methylase